MERREFMELAGMLTAGAVLAPRVVFGSQNEISDITTVVNDGNFAKEVSQYKGKSIVLFYAISSEKSLEMVPIFKDLIKGYGNQAKFCSYNLDENYPNWKTDQKAAVELKNRYGVDMIPTINMYLNGKLANRIRGPPSEKVNEKVIKEYIIKWIKS